jgi:hypothetical protein
MKRCRKNYLIIMLAISSTVAAAQTNVKSVRLKSTEKMNLNITPTSASSQNDFDFLVGKWKVQNRKLKVRLKSGNDWDEFESELHMKKALNGMGNVENYYASFDGKPFEGLAVRLFNPQTRLWTIYWMDTSGMMMDQHPVTGSFEKGVGKFYAQDTFDGKEILVIYQWDATDPKQPIWSQAFSIDNGKTWEWNWEMRLKRIQ